MVDESFEARLAGAAYWESWVGATLTRAGLYVLNYPTKLDDSKDLKHPDMVVSKRIQEHDAHGFSLELFDAREVEIKSLGLTFNNALSYPFDRVLICSQNSFLRKWPGRDYILRDFLLVSRKTGSVVWVPAMTKVELGVEVHDQKRNELYKAVACRREDLRELADFVDEVRDA